MIQKMINKASMKKADLEAKIASAMANRAGEAYIDTAVKVVIVVVLGCLLLLALTTLFGDLDTDGTVLGYIQKGIDNLFTYGDYTSALN